MIKQDKFIHSPLEKAIEKQTKIIEDQRNKQVKVLKILKPADEQKTRLIRDIYSKEQ